MAVGQTFRPAWAEVDLDAIRHNVRALAAVAEPAELLAVVKADAYGHGAVPVARAALDAGATWLGVALVEEGVELRDAGIEARILLLSEPPAAAAATVVDRGITPMVYTTEGVEALARAVAASSKPSRADALPVHVKVDTGMHRVGCSPDDALAIIKAIDAHPELRFEGICTHLAVADEPENMYNTEQLDRFDALLDELPDRDPPLIVHAANSAGVLAHPRAHHHLVRCGIAIYGIAPSPDLAARLPDGVDLRPALALKAHVSHVKPLPAGASVSYGRHYRLPADAHTVTIPVGYADGVPRSLGLVGGQVLIGGVRRPIAGAVTMDQLVVDVGDDAVPAGEEVTLIGRQGDEEITAAEWADRLGVIPYEVTTRLGPRLPRVYTP